MHSAFAVIATVLAVVSGPSYFFDILRGKARPERATFFIFMVLSAIAFYGQFKLGTGLPLIFTGLDVGGSLATFLLALKFGVSGFGWRDKYALIVAGVGLVAALFTSQPIIAILGVMVADVVAIGLTLRKTYHDPDSEPYSSWLLFALAATFSALSAKQYTVAILLYPVYIAVSIYLIPITKFISIRAHKRVATNG